MEGPSQPPVTNPLVPLQGPRALGFALRFVGGRALLQARDLALETLPGFPPGISVEDLTLEVPNVRFPLDVSGGAERFQHKRLILRRLVLRATLPSLRVFFPAQLGGAAVETVTLRARDGQLEAEALLRTDEARDILLMRACAVPALPSMTEVVVTQSRWLGAHGGGGLEAAQQVLEGLGGITGGPLVRRLDVARQVCTVLMASHGWKVPDFGALRDVDVSITEEGLRLACHAEPPADAQPTRPPDALARGVAANTVLTAALDAGRARGVDRAAAHPLALALLSDVAARDGALRDEVTAALEEGLRRHGEDVDLMLALARAKNHDVTAWQRVVAGARMAGDPALVHAAALAWGKVLGASNPQAGLAAFQLAAEARPESPQVSLALALLCEKAGDWGEAVRAARAALEMDLSAQDETAAALCLGRARLALKDAPAARRALLRALRHGETAPLMAAMAQLLEAEERFAEAVRHHLRAAELSSEGGQKGHALCEAARLTQVSLKDPSGSVVLWQQGLALASTASSRALAAQAAWDAHDVELAAQWALGPQGQYPSEPALARVAGLALWRQGGRDRDALQLLERAGADTSLRTPEWEDALAELRSRMATIPPPPRHAPAGEVPVQRMPQPAPIVVTLKDLETLPPIPEERTGTTRLFLPVEDDEDAPAPGENVHDGMTLPPEEITDIHGLVSEAPTRVFTRVELTPAGLAAMEPVEAATVFFQAYSAAGAPRDELLRTVRDLVPLSPERALRVLEELADHGVSSVEDWRALMSRARADGLAPVELAALEQLKRLVPEQQETLLLRQVDLLVEQGNTEDALARVLPAALASGGALATRAADLAEELGQLEVALRVMAAEEQRCTGPDALAWARRARSTASLAGHTQEAVEAALRAARLGSADDADQLEEALEAAGSLQELCAALWKRARAELDGDRAVRAARLEMGASGHGAKAAVKGLEEVLEMGATATPAVAGALRDAAAASGSVEEKAHALMVLLRARRLPEVDRMDAAASLESMTLPEPLAVAADDAILRSFPGHAPALARVARRHSSGDPSRAAAAALALVDALAQRGAPAMERLTWLQFAAVHSERAQDGGGLGAVEKLLELARREPEAARHAHIDRRALLLRLAAAYEVQGQAQEAVRMLSAAEILEGTPDERAAVFKRIALLEENALGRLDRAAEAWEHALRARPDDDETVRGLARVLEAQRRGTDLLALHRSRADQAEGPRKAAHLLSAADAAALEPGNHAAAIELCREALRAAPLSDAPLKRLAELQRHAPAAALVRTLLMLARLRPGLDGAARLEDAGALLGGLMDRPRLAVVVFRAALARHPVSVSALRALAELYRVLGRPRDALETLGNLLTVTMESFARGEIRVARAELLTRELDDDMGAWEELQLAMEDAPGLHGVLPLAQHVAERLGLWQDVERFLSARLAATADVEEAQRLGLEGTRSLVRMEALDAAQRVARAAVNLDREQPTPWNALRDVAVLQEDVDVQREATLAMLGILKGPKPALAAQEALRLADLELVDGRALAAVDAFRTVQQLAPDTPGIAFKLGAALLEAGDAPEAWAVLSALSPSDAAPSSEEVLARALAEAATEAGMVEATAAWERVTQLAPRDAAAWQQLGTRAELDGMWALAAQAWQRGASLVEGAERGRLMRRGARALADASRFGEAADLLEEARSISVGPPAEHVLLVRWRLNARDGVAAAGSVRSARQDGAEVPEELLSGVALRLHQEGRTSDARKLLAGVGPVNTVALARVVLELSPDDVSHQDRARMLEMMAGAAAQGPARAALLENAARQWWTAQDHAHALRVMSAAVSSEKTPARALQLLLWGLEDGSLSAEDVARLSDELTPDDAARVGAVAVEHGRLELLPDDLLTRWASQADTPPQALRELARRAEELPPDEQVTRLQSVVEQAERADGNSMLETGDKAARQLAGVLAEKGDLEAARAWSLRLKEPTPEDLKARLAWLMELERWREALDTIAQLLDAASSDEKVAWLDRAVEVARDRLEAPEQALPYARRMVELRPESREARAALVELLEETLALAEAAREVASWAENAQGVEAQALWRKALQLAFEGGDKDARVAVCQRAFSAAPTVEHHRAVVAALTDAGAPEEAARQAEAWADRTGDMADVWEAVDALERSAQRSRAAELLLRRAEEALTPVEELRVVTVLRDAGLTRALGDRLRAALARDTSGLAHARFLEWMPRSATTPMEVARVTEVLAQREDLPGRWLDAAQALWAVGLQDGARNALHQARLRGASPDELAQLDTALNTPQADITEENRAGAPGWEDLTWLQGGPLPDEVEALQDRPGWVLRRLEQAAVEEQRLGLALDALTELQRRGLHLTAETLRQRAWLSDPDARPWLEQLVQHHPQLGGAACDLLTDQGPEAVVAMAQLWGSSTRDDVLAAQAYDRAATAAADALDNDTERASLQLAQQRMPTARRGRRLLEMARADGNLPAQLALLTQLSEVDAQGAANWHQERAELLLDAGDLKGAAAALQQAHAAPPAWERVYRLATLLGEAAIQRTALQALAVTAEDLLACAALEAEHGALDAVQGWLDSARRAGLPEEAAAWMAVELAMLRHDVDEQRALLTQLAQQGSGPAGHQLSDLSGADLEARLGVLKTLVDSGQGAVVLEDLRRLVARGPHTAQKLVHALTQWSEPHASFPPALQAAVDALGGADGDSDVAAVVVEVAQKLGFPEMARRAWEVLSQSPGAAGVEALRVLATMARRQGRLDEEQDALFMLLAHDPRQAGVHARLAELRPGPAGWPHRLHAATLQGTLAQELSALRTEARSAQELEWFAQLSVAVQGASGAPADPQPGSMTLADREAMASLKGFPPAALVLLVDAARREQDSPRLLPYLEAAVEHARVPPEGAHAELLEMHRAQGNLKAALHHATRATEHLPQETTLARARVDLARDVGTRRELADALLHLARLVPAERAPDLALEAAALFQDVLNDPAQALAALKGLKTDDPRVAEMRVTLARASQDPAQLATVLEEQLQGTTGTQERAQLTLEVADAWTRAMEPNRAMAVLIAQAAQSLAACEALRDAALERGEAGTALAVVRSRWAQAGSQERRALVAHWLRTWTRLEEPLRGQQREATRDLALIQHTADAEDGETLAWMARDAESARRWEAAGQRWLALANLANTVTLPDDILNALQTQGLAVLARTGSLEEAEKLAALRLAAVPTDRGAMEVLLASARGRGDAGDVVKLLSTIARTSESAEEKAFIWRESAEWLAGPLMDPAGAVTALRAAATVKPLNEAEATQMARLAQQAQDPNAELEALEHLGRVSDEGRARVALRRAELMERKERPADAVLDALRDALADAASRVVASQRVAELALRLNRAPEALGWVSAVEVPQARKDATRYWQARAMLAEGAANPPESIKAHAELASLGETRSAARVGHWLMKSGRPAQAARAYQDAAARETAPEVRVELLREAITAWEAAQDAAAADEARLQLLDVDARDVAAYDAVELRLRRQGKTQRLPALCLRVAQAQEDPAARARLFERAGYLLRDVSGDEAAAAAAFASAVEADPFRSRCLLALADLAFRRNNLEEAARWFSQVPEASEGEFAEIPAAELAYRRGASLEATGGDGRVALRRSLDLDPSHASARAALASAAERHGDPLEAATTLMHAQDVPSANEEPRAFATWMLKQAANLQGGGQQAAAQALLEQASQALPGNAGLVRALAAMHRPQDPAAAAGLFRRVSQLSATPEDRAAALREEADAWAAADRPSDRAEALTLAVQQVPEDRELLRTALDVAASQDAQALLVRLSTPLHALQPPLELPAELHLALAQSLSQDRKVSGADLLRHAVAALASQDTWHTRLLAVGAARRASDHAALVTHVQAALKVCPDPKMGAVLASEAARAALMELRDVDTGAALVRAAAGMGGADAKVRARLAEIFPEPLADPALVQNAARALLEDGADVAEAYTWLQRVAVHQRDQRRVLLCGEALALLGGREAPTGEQPALRPEASRALSLAKDGDWLARGPVPVRTARLVATWAKEIHGVLQRPDVQSRSLTGDEARKLATDIRFARSLVDGTLPVVITDQPGAHLGGLIGPHLVLGPDVVRAPERVRRAVLAVGFATVRWGFEPAVTSSSLELNDLMRALRATLEDTRPDDMTTRATEMAGALEKSLRGRALADDAEMAQARAALQDGRLPGSEESRTVLARLAFLACGSLSTTMEALEKVSWMEPRSLLKSAWSRSVLRWVCLEEGVEARVRLGLETLDV